MIRIEWADEGGLLPQQTRNWLTRCAETAVQAEGVRVRTAVALHIVGDDEIHVLNREYRGIDRATDVLSFPTVSYPYPKTAGSCEDRLLMEYDDELQAAFLGDIILSMDHARAQAAEYGHSEERECGYLFVHGLFHLMGYDHIEEEDRVKMRAMEEKVLSLIGLTRG
ncbi:MAG: rRNA maturation RNase YbeY [Clostridia bacterium]|nr:rRNA maturation RNase YbeY [Clostridia bacterium]